MNSLYINKQSLIKYTFILISGFLYILSFAPYEYFWLIYISVLIFLYLLESSTKRESIKLSFLYGLSIFSFGVNWIYNSIYNYGGQYFLTSLCVTIIFIFFLSLFFIPIGYFINKETLILKTYKRFLIIPSVWIFFEWLRSNLFTGFPWLLVGYSHTDTYLNPLFSLIGTFGVGFFIIFFVTLFISIFNTSKKAIPISIFLLTVSLVTLINLNSQKWVNYSKNPITFSVIQANINQADKFNKANVQNIKLKYELLTQNILKSDLIIWPETPIPKIYKNDKKYFNKIYNSLEPNTAFLSGIFRYDVAKQKIFNSIVLKNKNEQFYDKRHLVPFGEYTPLEKIFTFLTNLFLIPISNISSGDDIQQNLLFNEFSIIPLICYEIAYPELINLDPKKFGLIVNVSNDAWFGDSLAPHQHLQISQARALETNYYIIRSANTGISALVSPNGKIIKKIELNKEGILYGKVFGSQGQTPYMLFGDYPLLMLIFISIFLYIRHQRHQGSNNE